MVSNFFRLPFLVNSNTRGLSYKINNIEVCLHWNIKLLPLHAFEGNINRYEVFRSTSIHHTIVKIWSVQVSLPAADAVI